jgi:predicted CXXCH cytochrome family protein
MRSFGGTFPFGVRAHHIIAAGKSPRRSLSSFARALACLLLMAGPIFAANHPAVTGKNANCALCHADMTQGGSVHSKGELACGLCHSSEAGGSTVEMLLTIPKDQLCFACHERNAMQPHVSSDTNKDCLGCHDAHRSARAMLLLRNVDMNYAQSGPTPADLKHPNATSKPKSHVSTKRHRQHPAPTDHEM